MNHNASWSPYAGSGSLLLALVLFLITGILIYLAMRLQHPITVKRPGKFLGVTIVVIWLLSGVTFLVAYTAYILVLYQQVGHLTGPTNPISPITDASVLVTFLVIAVVAFIERHSGFWVAIGSAIVGAIAGPMIFELPFDLIVMWRTYPPTPAVLFTLLFFLPLFLVEITSFAMLALSPLMQLSRYTLLLLAGMFLIFAVWAIFGFAYPSAPLPIALNVISKVLAFATVISLFLPQRKAQNNAISAPEREVSSQASVSQKGDSQASAV